MHKSSMENSLSPNEFGFKPGGDLYLLISYYLLLMKFAICFNSAVLQKTDKNVTRTLLFGKNSLKIHLFQVPL